MSNVAKIDVNDKPTWLLWNATQGKTETAYVDPVTGAVLVYSVPTDGNTPTAINRALIDGNDNPTLSAYNDTSGLVEALRCDANGSLLVQAQ